MTSKYVTTDSEKREEAYNEWVEHIGGKANVRLREIIFSKRLAN